MVYTVDYDLTKHFNSFECIAKKRIHYAHGCDSMSKWSFDC